MPDSDVKIIKAQKHHIKGIMALEEQSFGCDAFNSRQFNRALKSQNSIFITAAAGTENSKLNDGRNIVAGYAIGTLRKIKTKKGLKKYGRVYSIAVSPQFKGKSIGAGLLRELENRLCSAGCSRIYLEVRVDNTAAISLYQKFNYEKIGTLENYYHDGSPAFKFVKETRKKQ